MFTAEEVSALKVLTAQLNPGSLDNRARNSFYALIQARKFCALFYSHLSPEDIKSLPSDLTDLFSNKYLLNLQMQLRQKRLTLEMIRKFNEQSIPVIALKGPLLGERIYTVEGSRDASGDMDILIRYHDFQAAQKLLSKEGYQIKLYRYPYLEDSLGQIFWRNSGNKLNIDLHWKILEKFVADLPGLLVWENTEENTIDGVKVKSLSNELLFLYLAVILWKESGGPGTMKYFLDLYWFFVKHKGLLDYGYLVKTAAQYNLKFYLLFFFRVLGAELGLDYTLHEELQGYLEKVPVHQKIAIWIIKKTGLAPASTAFLLKKSIIGALVFSKGSIIGAVRWFYLNFKTNYLLYLDRKELNPSIANLFMHLFCLSKRLLTRIPAHF